MHPVEQEKKNRPEKSSDPKMTESKLTILFTNIDWAEIVIFSF